MSETILKESSSPGSELVNCLEEYVSWKVSQSIILCVDVNDYTILVVAIVVTVYDSSASDESSRN